MELLFEQALLEMSLLKVISNSRPKQHQISPFFWRASGSINHITKNSSSKNFTNHSPHLVDCPLLIMTSVHYAKSYRPFELFINENYKLRMKLK